MEEFLLKLLERRAAARVTCASAALLFFVAAIVFYLAGSYWNYANELQPRYWWQHSNSNPVWFERFLEAGKFYSLGLGLLFTFLFFWSLTSIAFPRFSWFRLLTVAIVIVLAIGSYLSLADEHAILWIIWKDYPLSEMTVGILLILSGILLYWLTKHRKGSTREV